MVCVFFLLFGLSACLFVIVRFVHGYSVMLYVLFVSCVIVGSVFCMCSCVLFVVCL